MISLELAHRLKESGYPQHLSAYAQYRRMPGEPTPEEEVCYVPTLEDLIRELPKTDITDRLYLLFTDPGWEAGYQGYDIGPEDTEIYQSGRSGDTPEDALANLWLSLHASK